MSSQPNSVISRTPESPRTPIAADHLHVPASKFNGGNGSSNGNGDAGEVVARILYISRSATSRGVLYPAEATYTAGI